MRCEDRVKGIGGCPAPSQDGDRCPFCGTYYSRGDTTLPEGIAAISSLSRPEFGAAVLSWQEARDTLGRLFYPAFKEVIDVSS